MIMSSLQFRASRFHLVCPGFVQYSQSQNYLRRKNINREDVRLKQRRGFRTKLKFGIRYKLLRKIFAGKMDAAFMVLKYIFLAYQSEN